MAKKRKASDSASSSRKKRKVLKEGAAEVEQGDRDEAPPVREEAEECFPRGGQEALSAFEKRTIQQRAVEDVLFGGDDGEGVESGHQEGKAAARPSLAHKAIVAEQPAKKLKLLSPKNVSADMLLLGVVNEISPLDVTVSLPFNMRGSVAISEVSDPITAAVTQEAEKEESDTESGMPKLERLFQVGALVVVCVQAASGPGRYGRLTLSTNPRLVNAGIAAKDIRPGMVLPCWVQSVEDHGYIVAFGIHNKTGFLLRKNAAEFVKERNRGKPLCLGQVLQCVVCAGPDARSVPVSVNPSTVFSSLIPGDSLVPVHTLLPGMLVNAAVREVALNGLLMSFLGGVEGVVSSRHLLNSGLSTEKYQPGKKLRVRLLWTNPADKAVGLTLQRCVVAGRTFDFAGLKIGDSFHDAAVLEVDRSSALYLDLGQQLRGFAPLPLVSDERPDSLGKAHRPGTRHACRIIHFNRIDGVAIVSLQQSVLEKPYMRFSDISIGDIVEGVVERLGDYGMVVAVTTSLHGVCPKTHMSDARLKQPRRKFRAGAKVKCRVLNVTPDERRLLLTCKKSLLRSDQALLADYAQALPGTDHLGVVTAVKPSGLVVHFFGEVSGFVTRSELSSTQFVSDPAAVFWPGQSLTCRVLRCSPVEKKLLLSLKLDATPPASAEAEGGAGLAPGSLVECEVTGVDPSGLSLRAAATGELAFLPLMHLSDHTLLCPHLLSLHQAQLERAVKEGKPYILPSVLIVCSQLSFRPALATLKGALHAQAGNGFASDLADLKMGMVVAGFIKKSMSYGCFVELPHHLSGLAPSKYLADEFVSDGAGLYRDMQSVYAKVMEVDTTRGRFLLSLRPSDLRLCHHMEEEEVAASLEGRMEGYLTERDSILEEMAKTETESASRVVLSREAALVRNFHPGKAVEAQVASISDETVSLELPEGVAGRASVRTYSGKPLEVGGTVSCCMLDADLAECCVVVSLSRPLVEAARGEGNGEARGPGKRAKRLRKTKQETFQPASSVEATVEYITAHYLMCSCMTLAGARLAYGLIDTGQLGVLPPHLKYLKPGQKVSATVLSVASKFRGSETGPSIVMVTGTPATELRLRGSGGGPTAGASYDVKVGDVISVVVENIKPTHLNVKYHLWKGRVHCCLAQDSVEQGTRVFAKVSVGDSIKARVVKVKKRDMANKVSKRGSTLHALELTTKPSLMDLSVELVAASLMKKSFSPGEEVMGFLSDVSERGLLAMLSPRATAFIHPMLASSNPEGHHGYCDGMAVKCTLLECTKSSGKEHMYRASLIGALKEASVGDVTQCDCASGRLLKGDGLMVSTPYGFGRVDITDVSDHYVEKPFEKLRKLAKPTRCCVVGTGSSRLELSLRASRTGGGGADWVTEGEGARDLEVTSLEELVVGKVLRGYVKAVTDVGVFVRLGRNIDGRVKIGNIVDGYVKYFKTVYSVGDLVPVKVLEVNPVKKQMELSLRLSHVDPVAAKKRRREEGMRGGVGRKVRAVITASDGESAELSSDDHEDEEEEEEEEEDEEEEEEDARLEDDRPSLQLGTKGFQWDSTPLHGMTGAHPSDSDAEEEPEEKATETTSKKSRRQKKAARTAEEAALYSTERLLLDSGRTPESTDDYERLLLGHPNSSVLWIQYIAFLLHIAEVDKARTVAEKALKTISFREEKEKLNVWVALMNLENLYGSQETLVKVFDAALKENEPIEVFFRLVTIYEQSKKLDLADQLYQTMVKRFSSSPQVWTQYGQFLMIRGKVDAARKLLQRSLKRISVKQQHIDLISKFSQLEFKHGEPERGRTMLESLVSSYPRRVDLWSVFIDMMQKLGNPEAVREIFERAINLKVSAKKMKFIFKRYLGFESSHGSPASVEAVKEKARAYVESRTQADVAAPTNN